MLPTSSAALPALSVILVLFSTAGLLLETAYRTNSQMEADFCRFQVCDTPRLIETARSRRLLLSPEAAALGLRESVDALLRDPAAAAVWPFLRLHHYDTSPIAARYLDFLLAHRLYPSAAAFWSDWGAPRSVS